jgi:hypothetical protein
MLFGVALTTILVRGRLEMMQMPIPWLSRRGLAYLTLASSSSSSRSLESANSTSSRSSLSSRKRVAATSATSKNGLLPYFYSDPLCKHRPAKKCSIVFGTYTVLSLLSFALALFVALLILAPASKPSTTPVSPAISQTQLSTYSSFTARLAADIWSRSDATTRAALQDFLRCCGFQSPLDRAVDSPFCPITITPDFAALSATQGCAARAETFARTWIVAGLLVAAGVCLGSWVVVTWVRRRQGSWMARVEARQRARVRADVEHSARIARERWFPPHQQAPLARQPMREVPVPRNV